MTACVPVARAMTWPSWLTSPAVVQIRRPRLVHVAVATPTEVAVASWRLPGDRAQVRAGTVQGVLQLALDVLGGPGEQDATTPR